MILAFGDLHGRIRAMYRAAEIWSEESNSTVDAIVQVGDFGIFPDPSTLESEKVEKYGTGDYAELAASRWKAPIPTYFCKGNNEDFDALKRPLLPDLTFVPDGDVIKLGDTRIAFLGGAWAPKSYASEEGKPNHISSSAVKRLFDQDFEVLICHEAPAGTRFPGKRYAVGAPPIRELILEKQPALAIHGHHHIPGEHFLGKTRVISLDLLRPARPESAYFPFEA